MPKIPAVSTVTAVTTNNLPEPVNKVSGDGDSSDSTLRDSLEDTGSTENANQENLQKAPQTADAADAKPVNSNLIASARRVRRHITVSSLPPTPSLLE